MAIVTTIEKQNEPAKRNPTETRAFYRVGSDIDGGTILQIRTVGSANRQKVGAGSQTIQVTARVARELYDIIGREFGFERD